MTCIRNMRGARMPASEEKMPSDSIEYFDRYRNELCTERVYGEKYLRWTYATAAGRLALWALVKRSVFSQWYGWRMDRPVSQSKVLPFISEFGLDPAEFADRPEEYRSFNDFFSRRLRPEARPIDSQAISLVFPVDGRHLCIPDLSATDGLFVKGQMFDLSELLNDDELTEQFRSGALLLSRLCPTDYHRFHFPADGTPGDVRLINGPLYSVNPIALRWNIRILAQNKRTITIMDTEDFGRVLLLEIGATNVGSIHQTYNPKTPVSKGDEKGFFRFGGSSTVTIFEPGRIRFDEDLVHHSSEHRELYARMGDRMAVAEPAS